MSEYLELSSRLQNIDTGYSDGASCNTFVVADSIEGADGIAEMLSWALRIPCKQGAPTLILSNIRPKGSPVSSGVTARGVCDLVRVIDGIVTYARRPGKKNSACVVFLDANHADLDEYLSSGFNNSLDTVYLGVLIDPEQTYSNEVLEKLVTAYENKRIFINKLTYNLNGEKLYPNVCNEIRQKHKSSCTLAAIKLHEMADLSFEEFGYAFAECAEKLIRYLPHVEKNATENPDLYNFERQVGLGFVGMANFLGKLGTTYQKESEVFADWKIGLVDSHFWDLMEEGIYSAYQIQKHYKVDRMFTSQPTAHTALRLKDGDYAVSPELSPIVGGTRASDGLVRVYRKSSIDKKYDMELVYPEYVQTQSEVPYETYRKFCECLAELINTVTDNSAHTFSHCFYGDVFTLDDLKHFLGSPLQSLYYRLEPIKVERDKTRVDDLGDISDLLEETEPDDFLLGLSKPAQITSDSSENCPIDPYERLNCEACSM